MRDIIHLIVIERKGPEALKYAFIGLLAGWLGCMNALLVD